MQQFLRVILPSYFIVYFGITFIAKGVIVGKRIGKNPIVLPKDDSLYGLVGIYFRATIILVFLYVMVFAFVPEVYKYFLPIVQINKTGSAFVDLFFMTFALVWTIVAQANMRSSWRISIDTVTKTELVTTGLFRYSRNPIFFGMMISLAGLFLTTPNALTAIFLILTFVLIQIQIRLEEEFLTKQHGQKYLGYKQRVRRSI